MHPPLSKKRKMGHSETGSRDELVVASEQSPISDSDTSLTPSFKDKSAAASHNVGEQIRARSNGLVPEDSSNGRSIRITPAASNARSARGSRVSESVSSDVPAYFGESSASGSLKFQVDQLLKDARPRYKKIEPFVREILGHLKAIIEEIPDGETYTVTEAEQFLRSSHVRVPFPTPRPPKDAKYKLCFIRPSSINAVGSFPLQLAIKSREGIEVDFAVTMPSALFQEKDFLDYRYFYKRAYYMGCIAAGIADRGNQRFKLHFEWDRGDRTKPVLILRPNAEQKGPNASSSPLNLRIRLLVVAEDDLFPAKRLLLGDSCVRQSSKSDVKAEMQNAATPFYNSSLRSDMSTARYLKLLHDSKRNCDSFADACMLGRLWLNRRKMAGDVSRGGFGGFEWAAMTATLLQTTQTKGAPLFSPAYTSFQLFKAMLRFLATTDLSKDSFSTHSVPGAAKVAFTISGQPVFWDWAQGLNLLFKMSPWSYQRLRNEAKTSLDTLNSKMVDAFQSLFVQDVGIMLCRFDILATMPYATKTSKLGPQNGASSTPSEHHALFADLTQGLSDRVDLINITAAKDISWALSEGTQQNDVSPITVAFQLNPHQFNRVLDLGPPAEDKAVAAAFRKFWGPKAELRRFKDGSIRESLVWSSKDSDFPVFLQVVKYIIERKSGKECARDIQFFGSDWWSLTSPGEPCLNPGAQPFQEYSAAFRDLENDVRSLDGLPLSIRSMLPCSAELRSASIECPSMQHTRSPQTLPEVMIEFEGSGRWPDELTAIQRTKIAFLMKLGELLELQKSGVQTRLGLGNEDQQYLNQGFLDVFYISGAIFRLRVVSEREQILLERKLRMKSLSSKEKAECALMLSKHKREFVRRPAHSQTVQVLTTRYPMLSPSIRLVKRWFASHLLLPYFSEELLELFVIRAFTHPFPWPTPSSPTTGLLRTLAFIAHWDWRNEPLIVDLGQSSANLSSTESSKSNSKKSAALIDATTRFRAWRKIDPALNRVVLFAATTSEPDGAAWTDYASPPKVVASRMTALAMTAMERVANQGLEVKPSELFHSPLTDFDFVLSLKSDIVGAVKTNRKLANEDGVVFKNLGASCNVTQVEMAGYNPAQLFSDEIERIYGRALVLFRDGGSVLAGLWNPEVTSPREWRINPGYSSELLDDSEEDKVGTDVAQLNKNAILAEICRLGGDLIRKVDIYY